MRNKGWVPDQHGAWGMLIGPLIVGTFLGTPRWEHLVLAVTAIIGFLAFHSNSLWWKTRKTAVYREPSLTYAALFVLWAAVMLLWHPPLLLWFMATPLGLVVLWRALVRDERSLLARSSVILVACLLTPIGYDIGTGYARRDYYFPWMNAVHPHEVGLHAEQLTPVSWWPWGAAHTPVGWTWVWICTAMLALYFIGTVPFVKTMIRKRRSTAWLVGSIAFHVVVTALVTVMACAGMVSWFLAVVWLGLTVRAAAFPYWMRHTGKPVRPSVIGRCETVASLFVLAAITI